MRCLWSEISRVETLHRKCFWFIFRNFCFSPLIFSFTLIKWFFFALYKNNFPSQNLSCGHIRRNEIFELKFTSEKFHRRVGVFAFFRSGCRREQSSRLFGTPCSPSTRSRRTVVVFFPCNVDDESVDFREPANKSNWRHPDGVLHRHKIRLMNWLVVRGSTFFSSLHDVVYFFSVHAWRGPSHRHIISSRHVVDNNGESQTIV